MRRKAKVSQEVHYFIHAWLMLNAQKHLDFAEEIQNNSEKYSANQNTFISPTLLYMGTNLFAFTSLEAVVNFLGSQVFGDKWEKEFGRISLRSKMVLLADKAGRNIDWLTPPYKYFFELKQFRENIVHARMERVVANNKIMDVDYEPGRLKFKTAESSLLKLCNKDFSQRSIDMVKAIAEDLALMNGIRDPLRGKLSEGTHSAELMEE